MQNIPNKITSIRLLLIPIFLICYFLPYEWNKFIAALIFVIAAVTDAVDGFLARLLKQETALGGFLDPVADKLIVTTALVLIVQEYHSIWISLPALLILSREITVSALREWMAIQRQSAQVKVSLIGKWKTTCQMLAIIGLIWQRDEWIIGLGYLLLYGALVLTLWSMWIYLQAAWPTLNGHK